MKVREILAQWLGEHGYDGLVNQDADCGCGLDDLIACDDACHDCGPAYRGPAGDGSADFWMYPTREAAQAAQENGDG